MRPTRRPPASGDTSLAVGGGRLTLPVVVLPFVERDPQLTAALSLVFLLPPLVALAAVHRRGVAIREAEVTHPSMP